VQRILAAVSGGVDSAVAAGLLLEQGCHVEGATLLLDPADGSAVQAGAEVCARLGVAHHVIDGAAVFRECVLEPFIRGYEEGLTPNPCVLCNPAVKFGLLLDWALAHGFGRVATGHYARIQPDEASGRAVLCRAADPKKDQSYVLCRLPQEILRRVVFPLGELTKARVRAWAEACGLPAAGKPDSQDLCFVRGERYDAWLRRNGAREKPGVILDLGGNAVGRHQGLLRYTVGQRGGLGAHGEPVYVVSKESERNALVIGPDAALYREAVFVSDVVWASGDAPLEPVEGSVKLRYSHNPCPCTVTPVCPGQARIDMETPQRAITPGQTAVWYDGDRVIGCGFITANG